MPSKDDRLSGAPRQPGSLLASSWRPRGRCPVAPVRSEAEAAANAHIVVGDVSPDVVEIPTGLTPRAQVLQPLRLITASPVIPIGFPPLVVRRVQHTVGRSASQTVITARPASAGAGWCCRWRAQRTSGGKTRDGPRRRSSHFFGNSRQTPPYGGREDRARVCSIHKGFVGRNQRAAGAANDGACVDAGTDEGIVKLTKGSSIDPQDTGLQPVANPA